MKRYCNFLAWKIEISLSSIDYVKVCVLKVEYVVINYLAFQPEFWAENGLMQFYLICGFFEDRVPQFVTHLCVYVFDNFELWLEKLSTCVSGYFSCMYKNTECIPQEKKKETGIVDEIILLVVFYTALLCSIIENCVLTSAEQFLWK